MVKKDRRGFMIRERRVDSLACLRLHGVLGSRTCNTFYDAVNELVTVSCKDFLICISRDCKVDGYGLVALSRVYNRIVSEGGKMVLIDLPNQCRNLKAEGPGSMPIVSTIKEGFRLFKRSRGLI